MFQKYFIPALIAIIAAFVAIVFIDKEYATITRLLVEEEKLDTDLRDAATVEEKRLALQAQFDAFPPDADKRLQGLLPEKVHPTRMILDVQKIAQKYGLQLDKPTAYEETKHAEDGQPADLQTTTIKFGVSATYEQLKMFLREIERSLTLREPTRVSIIPNLDLAAIPEMMKNPILNVELTFESYSFPGSSSGRTTQ